MMAIRLAVGKESEGKGEVEVDIGTEGEALVHLRAYWNLVERIPNKHGCANLLAAGDSRVAPEVAKLIEKWQGKGWVKGVYSSPLGDFVQLDLQRVDKIGVLLSMTAEWGRLQWRIKPPRPTIFVGPDQSHNPS